MVLIYSTSRLGDSIWEWALCNVFAVYASQLATKEGEGDIISIVFASQPAANYANEHRRRIDSPTCNLTPLHSPLRWDLPTKYYSHFHYEHAWIKSYVLVTSKSRSSHSFFIDILIEILILIIARFTHICASFGMPPNKTHLHRKKGQLSKWKR